MKKKCKKGVQKMYRGKNVVDPYMDVKRKRRDSFAYIFCKKM